MPTSQSPSPPQPQRSRFRLTVVLALIVATGLASRAWPACLPTWFGKYPGDVLWGAMILAGLALLRPDLAPTTLAGLALATCTLVEVSQLCQAPWLNALRSTRGGHLVLGTTFHWPDLAAYAAGIAAGHAVDRARWTRRTT